VGDGNILPFIDPLQERQEPPLKRQIHHLDRCRLDRRRRTPLWRSSCSAAQNSAQALNMCAAGPRRSGPTRMRVRHLKRSRLLYFAAVLSGPLVRISLLTCGVKGTRTPDLLLANNRQHVHPRPSPQVTVPGRAPGSTQIQACCGNFVLYSPLKPTGLRRP
jgi:hypothetical protein